MGIKLLKKGSYNKASFTPLLEKDNIPSVLIFP
jgi:hypothetical protein